ncbi:tryptophan--tRNA ligase [Spirochaetota bacterium]|nr:tryptophan--tRNA ligase [Spirochaetota bacterium]
MVNTPPSSSSRAAKSARPIAVTGIKPTGKPHLGNYFASIQPAIALSAQHESYFFIADYHALNSIKDPSVLQAETLDVVATWLACGLDPQKVAFYLQSDIPELFEITIILLAYTSKGLMNRAHAYKAFIQNNRTLTRDADEGVNMGLYNYPVMMAADILAFKCNIVPIGKDQVQHLEMTQDIAEAFNRNVNKSCLVYPHPFINENVKTIIGTDGRKMSKSYHNTIPIFADADTIYKTVMKIITTSQSIEAVKDPGTCNVFALYKLFASPEDSKALANKYRQGGLSWGAAKKQLAELIITSLEKERDQYNHLIKAKDHLKKVLTTGQLQARRKAQQTLREMKSLIGIFHAQ